MTVSADAATNDLTITGFVGTSPGAVFAKETNNVLIREITNTGSANLTNVQVGLYTYTDETGDVLVNTTTIPFIASGGTVEIYIIDPTIRNLEGGSVAYDACVDPNNLISETNENNNWQYGSFMDIKYNGYKGKGLYWEGGSNITTKHTFDLQGNFLYSTQPDSAYKSVGGWGSGRTETWTTGDLPVPSGSTIEKVYIYFSYNWDQTAGGYPWLNLNFNGNTIENGNLATGNGVLYRDWSNFGTYSDYEYGLCVYDVTDKFSSSGNTLVTTPYNSNNALYGQVALYPTTLAVIYNNSGETWKKIFINEECDELGLSENKYGTTPLEATAYAPFPGVSVNVTKATLYSFAGSAGESTGEGNLLFNGNLVATNAWIGNSKTATPLVFDATNYITANENVFGIQGTTSGGMDTLQNILVVEYQKSNNIPEFPSIALPVAAFLGLLFVIGRRKEH